MKLYITDRELLPLCGIIIKPQFMGLKVTHLTLTSRVWGMLFIDVDESVQEGPLRFLYEKCKHISACCLEYLIMHQLYLLVELCPESDDELRKAFLGGGSIRGVLPEIREHGSKAGQDTV